MWYLYQYLLHEFLGIKLTARILVNHTQAIWFQTNITLFQSMIKYGKITWKAAHCSLQTMLFLTGISVLALLPTHREQIFLLAINITTINIPVSWRVRKRLSKKKAILKEEILHFFVCDIVSFHCSSYSNHNEKKYNGCICLPAQHTLVCFLRDTFMVKSGPCPRLLC